MALDLSPCVFVADDDENDQFLLHNAFARHSPQCRLVFAQDGLALLDALDRSLALPTLLILDLNMPRLSGFEALEQLRQHARYQHIPIIILTTSNSDQDRQRAQTLKATEFMTKPMNGACLDRLVIRLRTDWLSARCC